ncbi:MAG: cell division protein FtsA [Armatimonadetes bacterium]|nr:cell division protein FtsA [Armatimonadota bacterium]
MPRDSTIVGLDIGTTKIATVVGTVNDRGRLEILGVGVHPSRGLKKAVVVDVEDTTDSIRQSVEKAQRMAGTEIRSVHAGITGEHISSLNSRGVVTVTGPDKQITEEDVRRALETAEVIVIPPDREIIHTVTRGFKIDGQDGVKRPIGMCGARLEVETHIVTGAATFIHNVVRCVERAGLDLECLVLEPIATSEAVVTEAEKDLGVALVDIGGGTSDIAVFHGGSIAYSSAIPVGGNHVSRDISIGLRTSFEAAERIKVEHGVAMEELVGEEDILTVPAAGTGESRKFPKRILAQIIEPRMEELFVLMRKEVEKSGYEQHIAGGAIITGGGSLLPGTVPLAERVLEMPVRVGKPTQNLIGMTDAVSSPIYATGVGLVHYGARYPREERPLMYTPHRFLTELWEKVRRMLRLGV